MKLTFEALRDLDTAYVIAKIYIKIRAEKCRVNEEEIEQRISGSSEDLAKFEKYDAKGMTRTLNRRQRKKKAGSTRGAGPLGCHRPHLESPGSFYS